MAEAPVQQPGDVFAALENNLRPIRGLEVRFFLSIFPAILWIKLCAFFVINLCCCVWKLGKMETSS